MRRFLGISLIFFTLLTLSACGGSGESSTTAISTGVFVDAPVQGLRYVFGTYSGITGPGGTFCYPVGSSGVFRVGDITIGRAAGQSVVTPVDLVKTRHPEYTDMQARMEALKLVQFLTSVGGWGNQTGLFLPPEVSDAAQGASFRNIDLLTADLQAVLGSLGTFTLTSTSDAAAHFAASTANLQFTTHCGIYVSTDGNGVMYLSIDPFGTVSGFMTDSSGEIQPIYAFLNPPGSIEFGNASDAVTRDVGYSGTGSSDGGGGVTCSITTTEGKTFNFNLRRVTPVTNPYVGVFSGTFEGTPLSGTSTGMWVFGIDADGNLVGATFPLVGRNAGSVAGTPLSGRIDMSTGKIVMDSADIRFTGSITGTAVTGTWASGTESGTVAGWRYP